MNPPSRCMLAAIVCCVAAMFIASAARAQNAPPEAPAAPQAPESPPAFDTDKRGLFTAAFPERSDHSKPAALGRAFGSGALRGFNDYNIAEQTFSVFVPKEYDGDRAHGLIIWLGDEGAGGLPRKDWENTLNRFKLIFIAPHNAGREAPPARRLALALDALHNANQHYTIDPGRVYAAGYGEAAPLAALLLGAMPSDFSGVIFVNGSALPPGRGRAAQQLRENARIGFLIGEKAKAREQADHVFEEHYKEQFKHLERHVARGDNEGVPTNRYFESTIFALEKPLPDTAKDLLASAARAHRGRKYAEAWLQFATAAARSVDDTIVQQADKGIAALREELNAELVKVAQIQVSGNEPASRSAALRLQREWGRWGRLGLDRLARGDAPAVADANAEAPSPGATASAPARPAAVAAAAPSPRTAREETALRRLEVAREQLSAEPAEAYEVFESIVKRYPGTPAARAAAIELAQLDADPDQGPAIAATLAERRSRALLSLAKSYQQAGARPLAVETLRELLAKYPDSEQAAEAKFMLMELGERL